MCEHTYGEALDDCVLQRDPVTGLMRCWAHPPVPAPREPSPVEQRLDRLMQGERWRNG